MYKFVYLNEQQNENYFIDEQLKVLNNHFFKKKFQDIENDQIIIVDVNLIEEEKRGKVFKILHISKILTTVDTEIVKKGIDFYLKNQTSIKDLNDMPLEPGFWLNEKKLENSFNFMLKDIVEYFQKEKIQFDKVKVDKESLNILGIPVRKDFKILDNTSENNEMKKITFNYVSHQIKKDF